MHWLADRRLPVLVAVTKADKLTRDKQNRKVSQIETDCGVTALAFSAVTGQGKDALLAAIRDLVQEHTEQMKVQRNG
jgi:GTP-binding protein EngB required for normal cell division